MERTSYQMSLFHRLNGFAFALVFGIAPCAWSQTTQPEVVTASATTPLPKSALPPMQSPGTLLLCGGGQLPQSLLDLFHQHGQGEQGKLVVIPTASRLADAGDNSYALATWSQFKWASVDILHAFDRAQAEVEEFANTLKDATAVWMSGGDQQRLAQRYQGTAVEREIRNVMLRGGVVGGTSAGSAIASRVMISGGQKQPTLADGLDLLPNSIIDQHFSQRKRFERLASAVANHPDRVGIGIDESTGLLVNHKRAQVVGNGSVYVYANSRPMKIIRVEEPILSEASNQSEVFDDAAISSTISLRPLRVSSGEAMESEEFPLLGP
jgi:cyanophycinase